MNNYAKGQMKIKVFTLLKRSDITWYWANQAKTELQFDWFNHKFKVYPSSCKFQDITTGKWYEGLNALKHQLHSLSL